MSLTNEFFLVIIYRQPRAHFPHLFLPTPISLHKTSTSSSIAEQPTTTMRSIRAVGLTGLRFTAPCANGSAVHVARQQALRALSTSTPKAQLKTAVPSQSVSFDQELRRLNEQRSVRPVSPVLSIYQPQLTWYGSIANRFTGAGLSGGGSPVG